MLLACFLGLKIIDLRVVSTVKLKKPDEDKISKKFITNKKMQLKELGQNLKD